MVLDDKYSNSCWKDAIMLVFHEIHQHDTFIDRDHCTEIKPPKGHKTIRVHFVFDVKHDGRYKARIVDNFHLTALPLELVYLE
jgi:hypothetical protein